MSSKVPRVLVELVGFIFWVEGNSYVFHCEFLLCFNMEDLSKSWEKLLPTKKEESRFVLP